jgi:hypothetical protein
MFILYKNSMDNSNIVGYFASHDVIEGSIKLSYSGIKGLSLRHRNNTIEVLSIVGNKKESIDRFIIEPLFIHTRPDHL